MGMQLYVQQRLKGACIQHFGSSAHGHAVCTFPRVQLPVWSSHVWGEGAILSFPFQDSDDSNLTTAPPKTVTCIYFVLLSMGQENNVSSSCE